MIDERTASPQPAAASDLASRPAPANPQPAADNPAATQPGPADADQAAAHEAATNAQPELSARRRAAIRVLDIIEPLVLVLVPLGLVACVYFKVPNSALVTALFATASIVPFFIRFEVSRPRARDFMPIVVLSALAVAARLVFAPIPAINPVDAIVIVAGIAFGRQAGFLTGSLAMLVSNIFVGQGPWTPWQMYCMGLEGYLAGIIWYGRVPQRRWPIVVFGVCSTLLYGFIMDTWSLIGFTQQEGIQQIITIYGQGLFYNIPRAIGTVVFLTPIALAWPKMFERVKTKYALDVTGSQHGRART